MLAAAPCATACLKPSASTPPRSCWVRSMLPQWMTHAPAEGFERLTVALRRVPPTTTPGRMRAAWAGAALGSTMQWEGDWVVSGDELESMIRELGDEYMAAQMQLGLG